MTTDWTQIQSGALATPPDLATMLTHWAERTPDAVLLVEATLPGLTSSRRWTAQVLHQQALSLAGALVEVGADKKRVALAVTMGAEAALLYLACQYAGIAPAMLPTPEHESEVESFAPIVEPLVKSFAPDFVVFGEQAAAMFNIEGAGRAWYGVLHPSRPGTGRVKSLTSSDLLACQAPAMVQPQTLPIRTPAHYLFTSGTTGQSKIVTLSRLAVALNIIYVAERWGFGQGDAIPALGAPFHSAGLMVGYIMPLYYGARALVISPYVLQDDPAALLHIMSAEGASHLACGDGLIHRALAAVGLERLPYSALKAFAIGGEPLNDRTHAMIIDYFSPDRTLRFLTAYGMTEAAGLISTSSDIAPRTLALDLAALIAGRVEIASTEFHDPAKVRFVASCGRPSHGVRLRIVDALGKELGEGQIGYIEFTSPSLFDGYLRTQTLGIGQPVLMPINRTDFFATEDLGFLFGEELFIIGRGKESIWIGEHCLQAGDVEVIAQSAHPLLAGFNTMSAQWTVSEAPLQSEMAMLLVMQEVPKDSTPIILSNIADAIEVQLQRAFGTTAVRIVLVPVGALPRLPTSAKKVRLRARTAYEQGRLPILFERSNSVPTAVANQNETHQTGEDCDVCIAI
ncbi:MAG: AMP-binding protein [Nostoc sp. DedSLP03]|uniref:AMP-binding protein n=1 Tax=Nostoc sp. DedSLP03 TaxID=3075400 RepID=UPI002AD40490|nr:AMP-binding protein [Nostoc sp. DedSLP03]MDZ7970269.1 AMP-binding protein [Nostoc sp. DedSLP03]